MTFKVESTEYRIEFRHINRASKWGARKLGRTGGFKGLTTCVVVFKDPNKGGMAEQTVVAIETVFCSSLDQFTKEEGRGHALTNALRNCKRVPREHIEPLILAYKNRNAPEIIVRGEKNAVESRTTSTHTHAS